MPDYTNDSPVVLDIDGRMVAPGSTTTAKASHPAVKRGHLTPVPKPDPAPKPTDDEEQS